MFTLLKSLVKKVKCFFLYPVSKQSGATGAALDRASAGSRSLAPISYLQNTRLVTRRNPTKSGWRRPARNSFYVKRKNVICIKHIFGFQNCDALTRKLFAIRAKAPFRATAISETQKYLGNQHLFLWLGTTKITCRSFTIAHFQ